MKTQTFEDYLQDRHAEQYRGLDDDMPDDYAEWLELIGVEGILDYGTAYGATQYSLALKDANKMINQYLK